eukprot:gene31267-40637_t
MKEFKFIADYIWPSGRDSVRLKVFLVIAMGFMYLGKWFSLKVPFILQSTIDAISKSPISQSIQIQSGIRNALVFYGLSRAMSVVCSEIKTCLFAHVSNNVLRKFANQCFSHLHSLDGDFHIDTPSGVLSVAYVRAVRGFQTILFQIVFSVIPAALELFMVCRVLYRKFSPVFALVTLATFSMYLVFTVWITQFRIKLRQDLVDTDNSSNEKKESERFDSYLARIQQLSIDSTYAIGALNLGQAALFCGGLTSSLLLAYARVQSGLMSVGDLVAVNSMLLHLSVPFNFMGYTYQEIQQSLVDMSFMTNVLRSKTPLVQDRPNAIDINDLPGVSGPSSLEFRNVSLSYSAYSGSAAESGPLLSNISFKINKGQNVAIVGPSGSVDIQTATLQSLRKKVAVIPQDTCLFDASIRYNILYGSKESDGSASEEQLQRAIVSSNLLQTIRKLAQPTAGPGQTEAGGRRGSGLDTVVGERGARLSGGERQKVAIARALLRDPTLILCDEVTSSVDAFAERDIVRTLRSAAKDRTTITVAHRLSSIVHCDNILVIDRGELVEQGTHQQLLQNEHGVYRNMWATQNENSWNIGPGPTPRGDLLSLSMDGGEQSFASGSGASGEGDGSFFQGDLTSAPQTHSESLR